MAMPLQYLLLFLCLPSTAIQQQSAIHPSNRDANSVQFFSNQEKGHWVSFLNLKSTLTEKLTSPRRIPDLRIKVTLTKGGQEMKKASKIVHLDDDRWTDSSQIDGFRNLAVQSSELDLSMERGPDYKKKIVELKREGGDRSIIEEADEDTRVETLAGHIGGKKETATLTSRLDLATSGDERGVEGSAFDEEVTDLHLTMEGSASVDDTSKAVAISPDDEDFVEASATMPVQVEGSAHSYLSITTFLPATLNATEAIEYEQRQHSTEPIQDPPEDDSLPVAEVKSKVVITEMSSIDTRLFEKETMSMRVRDEQVAYLRATLTNSSALEGETGEGHRDYGGSFILPLLAASNYDNSTVPLIFADIPVHVRVQLLILYLGNFDSHLMEYTVDAEMNMRWYDLRLANNYTKPIRIREKEIIDKIWRPDPYFVNSKFSYFHRVSFPNFRMIITPQGLVSYTMRVTLLPTCPMVFCRYPHDRQECDLRMSSIAYPRSFLRFSWHSQPFSLQSDVTLPELHVTKMFTDICSVEGKLIASSCLRLVLYLKRDGSRYIVEKYIPSALAMMFGWVAPYVPYNYEEVRIVTPITVLLTLVQMEKGETQIRTSYITSLDIWFAIMKVFTVASLIESLAVLSLIKRSRAMEKAAERAANEFERAELKMSRHSLRRAVWRLDRLSRVASPAAFLCFLLYYVFVLSKGDEYDCI